MFDIGWPELMIIAVVALVVIGPKDLPKAIYGVGKWVRKARMVAREFQGHIDDMMREAELDDLRQQAMKARNMSISRMVEDTVDPNRELKSALEMEPPLAEQPKPATEPPKAQPVGTQAAALQPAVPQPAIPQPNVQAPPTPPETGAAKGAADKPA